MNGVNDIDNTDYIKSRIFSFNIFESFTGHWLVVMCSGWCKVPAPSRKYFIIQQPINRLIILLIPHNSAVTVRGLA